MDLTTDETWTTRVRQNGEQYGVYADYMYYRTGDVGGAPEEESVAWLEKSLEKSRTSDFKVVSSRADEFFLAITPER